MTRVTLTNDDLVLLARLLEQEFERLKDSLPPEELPLHMKQDHARECVRIANAAIALRDGETVTHE